MERLTYLDGGKWRMRIGDTEYSGKEVNRISAYEDLLDGYDLDRLRELVEADQEGRCVVLPCKPGEFVFANMLRKGKKQTVPLFVRRIDVVKAAEPEISTECVFLSMVHGPVYFTDFGQCVFANREEAEAALKGEQDG